MMSRVGKNPVVILDGVKTSLAGRKLKLTGPKGELSLELSTEVAMTQKDNLLIFEPANATRQARTFWGTQRALVANMMTGVSTGFTRELEIRGVGYRAQMQGKTLKLNLGFSHDIDYPVPEGIEIACPKPTSITISGIDKQKIGQIAAEIRAMRPPEPYKGKGVRYLDEYVFIKEGKKK